MVKIGQASGYILLILILFSILYGISKSRFDFEFTQQDAIEEAKTYCDLPDLQEAPHNFKAELLTCNEMNNRTPVSECNHLSPDLKVWFVSMDALWILTSPLGKDGVSARIPITGCNVLIEAGSGKILETHWNENH